ncbi:MAG: YdcF family protein [Actinobacteria bacterium]|nr:YdcF family protein [Actinomycetota bacterium]NBR93117.1 YdcF family protein [Actinomycetota bacterium]NDG76258.1 YdcF family protein [Acidimicrobiia bacterium]
MSRFQGRAEAPQVSSAPKGLARRVALGVAAGVLSLTAYFVVSLTQVWLTGRDDSFARSSARVDAVIVLGAAQYDGRPSPQFAARLDHALLLWQRGLVKTVVVTGGKQVGDRFTEAESGREYLAERGMPAAVIQVEPRGTSTFSSLETVAQQLANRRVVVVSDPYHVLRARLVASELGLDADVSATRTSVIRGVDALRRNMREALGVMVGRISGFRQLEAWLQ